MLHIYIYIYIYDISSLRFKGKGKVHPRIGHETLDGGGWSTPRPGRFTARKYTRYPLCRRLGGPQGRSGRVRKISPPTGIPSPYLPARSESLYRLSYPVPQDHVRRTCKGVYCLGRWVTSWIADLFVYRSVSRWFSTRFFVRE